MRKKKIVITELSTWMNTKNKMRKKMRIEMIYKLVQIFKTGFYAPVFSSSFILIEGWKVLKNFLLKNDFF